jgi:hypothetical protein
LKTYVSVPKVSNKEKNVEKQTYFVLANEEQSKLQIGSVLQWCGSADPDPYQNVADPEHCFKPLSTLGRQVVQ